MPLQTGQIRVVQIFFVFMVKPPLKAEMINEKDNGFIYFPVYIKAFAYENLLKFQSFHAAYFNNSFGTKSTKNMFYR